MPKIQVEISENNFKAYSTLPKQMKGKFIDAAITYFLKTAEGQAILDFFRINDLKTSAIKPVVQLNEVQYPDLDGWND